VYVSGKPLFVLQNKELLLKPTMVYAYLFNPIINIQPNITKLGIVADIINMSFLQLDTDQGEGPPK